MKTPEALEIIGELASQQWGLFTATQAKDAGVDPTSIRRLAERGLTLRMRHGVYAIAGTPFSPDLEVKALWLGLRPGIMAADRTRGFDPANDAVVSHSTAASIWRVGDLWPDGAHFTVGGRKRSRQPEVVFHLSQLGVDEWVIHEDAGLPVTSVPRTLVDLAEAGTEISHLSSLIGDAADALLTDQEELIRAFNGREDALGLELGDYAGLRGFIREAFPTVELDPRVVEAIEKSLAPYKQQMGDFLAGRTNASKGGNGAGSEQG